MAAKLLQTESPAALGYRMPAEWEPHEATWIAWPHNVADWPGRFAPVPWVYVDIVRNLSRYERVCILVQNESLEKRARHMLRRAGVDLANVEFVPLATNRVWTRDYGPIFLVRDCEERREVALTNWHFNAWAKYPDWQADDGIPDKLVRQMKLPHWKPLGGKPARRIVLEGGSIDVNGAGLMLTTEECLLSTQQQRNPGVPREEMERIFADYLGVKKVIWLRNGIAGDDTHGHVDDLARFTDPSTVVVASEADPNDANYEPLAENLALLRQARDQHGKPLRVETLPMPAPLFFDGQRLPASYANFYIANQVVLVPTFNDPNDRIALEKLASLFPGRKVIGIHSLELIWGLGALHCMTQQQPAASWENS